MIKHKNYRHIIPVQIRFSDVDRLQHVNNACYLNYFELGRVTYFRDVFKNKINWNKEGFILARTELNHLQPVFLNDEIYCCTRIKSFGNKSMVVQNAIIKFHKGEVVECAEGTGVLVAMNYAKQVSKKIPAPWKKAMQDFENENKFF